MVVVPNRSWPPIVARRRPRIEESEMSGAWPPKSCGEVHVVLFEACSFGLPTRPPQPNPKTRISGWG
eukprot:1830549-Pyramimonas_sp.AAC.1